MLSINVGLQNICKYGTKSDICRNEFLEILLSSQLSKIQIENFPGAHQPIRILPRIPVMDTLKIPRKTYANSHENY